MTPFRDGGILTKYFYTGIRVRDLERSIQFYRKVMGMKVTRRGRMSHGGIWVELKSPDSEQRLELNWYPTDSKFFTRYRKGEELDHLAFRVRERTRLTLDRMGLPEQGLVAVVDLKALGVEDRGSGERKTSNYVSRCRRGQP